MSIKFGQNGKEWSVASVIDPAPRVTLTIMCYRCFWSLVLVVIKVKIHSLRSGIYIIFN